MNGWRVIGYLVNKLAFNFRATLVKYNFLGEFYLRYSIIDTQVLLCC